MANWISLISNLTFHKITKWGGGGESKDGFSGEESFESDIFDANIVASKFQDKKAHALLLDLDVPAYLIPSSTPGHTHLYVDVEIPEDKYFDLLRSLADCGVIEPGYAGASIAKGGTRLRLPWIKKGEGV